jgi:endogenous inhibitor of DNA gyrase (YacG/DUF329 family)
VSDRDRTDAFPFCSARCRAIDLGRWFGDEYRVPGGGAPKSDPDDDQ